MYVENIAISTWHAIIFEPKQKNKYQTCNDIFGLSEHMFCAWYNTL